MKFRKALSTTWSGLWMNRLIQRSVLLVFQQICKESMSFSRRPARLEIFIMTYHYSDLLWLSSKSKIFINTITQLELVWQVFRWKIGGSELIRTIFYFIKFAIKPHLWKKLEMYEFYQPQRRCKVKFLTYEYQILKLIRMN